MKTIDYKAYFHAAYQGAADFNANILEPLFGSNLMPNDSNEYVREEDQSFIQNIHRCGEYVLNGDPIEFFDVTLTGNCQISRNRLNIKKTVVRLMEAYSGAFIVFHYSSTSEKTTWRFSWVEKLRGNSNTSAPKRYTYLCGPKYSCRTTGDRFDKLLKSKKDNKLTINSITNAFDVEALSEDFFQEYKVFYEDIVQYICGQRFLPKKGKKKEFELQSIESDEIVIRRGIFHQFQENFPGKDAYGNSLAEKAVRDYVKKLLGRLVFIQFLQKKGWLGISANQHLWVGGDTDFLFNLFSKASSNDKDNFVENVLEDILFDSFNKPNSIRNGIKYPYLNGGLFDRDKADGLKVKLPRALFVSEKENERKYIGKPTEGNEYDYTQAEGLFQFFDRYNFTIDENDPDDAIVGVDPEMLGKIFENLLEDNKDKGAFYTPKEIVQYMCRESLIAYLCNEVKGSNDAIRRLIEGHIEDNLQEEKNKKLYDDIQTKKDSLLEALRNVKICDPAIGSGAFPMGLLNLLLHIRLTLGDTDRCQIKKDIILNNIYGVDIEHGAIDIARLRFWLAIMVDETEPSPLPNFDYKFMQGNSLLENYEGIDLSNLSNANKKKNASSQQMALVFDEKGALENINSFLKSYFDLQGDDKKKRKDKINNEVKKYLECVTEGQNKEKQAEMLNIDVSLNDQFFLWHTWFADVFNRPNKQGFDIVIGNPPYINIANLKDKKARKLYQKNFETVKNKCDLYSIFTEQAYYLLRENGICSYIFSNSWLGTDSFSLFRKFLVDKTKVQLLVDLPDKVFKNAQVKTCIILYSKESVKKNTIHLWNYDGVMFSKMKCSLSYEKIKQYKHYPFSYEEGISLSKVKVDLLGNIADFTLGIKTSNDKKFISTNPFREDSYKLIRGRNIQRYSYPRGNEWIWYRPDLFMEKVGAGPRRLEFFTVSTKILVQDIATEICATLDQEKYLCNDTINVIYQLDKKYAFEYILGLLNSKAVRFWHEKIFPEGLHIKIYQLKVIPIPKISLRQQQPIIDLVDSILAKKKANPVVDTSIEERKIDILVYHLYDLTYDEVKIVDEELTNPENPNYLSEEDYNKM